MLLLRSPQTIALELFGVEEPPHWQAQHRWPAQEISGDCVFLNAQQARNETLGRDAPLAGLGRDWWVFASSGTGDAWLISMDESLNNAQQIAFLDHDLGADAMAQLMGLSFGQWLQMADLMHQWEACDDEEQASQLAEVSSLLDQISTGLSQRFPYAL